jgi:hydroxypyruvate isomerase
MPSRRQFLGASAGLCAASLLPASAIAAEPVEKPGKTPKTKFAVNIEMWWPKLPFAKRLEEAAKLGFEAFEFWPWRRQDATVAAIGEACEKFNIKPIQFTAWGFKPGLNDPANHTKFVDEVGASCETAKKLKVSMLCVVGGDDIPGKSQEQMHEAIIEGLKKAAPVAEKAGITLILEPMNIRVDHKGHCLYGSAPTIKIIKAVNSKAVKINWDLYHMHITEGDLCGHLREGFAADAVAYIQIADHPGRNEPGTGEIHYPRVFKELAALGYKGHVGLECVPKQSAAEAAQAVYRADAAW